MQLPSEFLKRMQTQIGGDFAAYLDAMNQPVRRALRVNTLKISVSDFISLCDFSLEPTGMLPESFFFPDAVAIGRHPLHTTGLCYVQEPSASLPAALLPIIPGMMVLDLCAAPGGKSGQLAAKLGGSGLLIANEPVPARANVLQFNLERLGVTNMVITCCYPEALASALPGFFDAVLVDAPCSGEGMFRRDAAAVAAWSPEHVHACALRQHGILEQANTLLKSGGHLVYSTCTFSPEENDGIIEAFLSAHPDNALLESRQLYPHTCAGEGQFAAILFKGESVPPSAKQSMFARRSEPHVLGQPLRGPEQSAWLHLLHETCFIPPANPPLLLPDGRIVLPPQPMPPFPGIRILRAGLLAAELKTGRVEPNHALFLGLPASHFRNVLELSDSEISAFLAGETVPCNANRSGWCAACFHGYPLGFGKAVSGTLKNHLPKGLWLR
ncbi:MAG: RsmF rRNA methyltransferase first C-terminal domain-containing protein [Clostridia bacterium]